MNKITRGGKSYSSVDKQTTNSQEMPISLKFTESELENVRNNLSMKRPLNKNGINSTASVISTTHKFDLNKNINMNTKCNA